MRQIRQTQARTLVHGHAVDQGVIQCDLPIVCTHQANHHVKARRFSRAIWPQKANDFTTFDIKRNVFDDGSCAITFFELIDAEVVAVLHVVLVLFYC